MRIGTAVVALVLLLGCESSTDPSDTGVAPGPDVTVEDVTVEDVTVEDVTVEDVTVEDVMEESEVTVPPSCEAASALVYENTGDETFHRGPYLQSVHGDSAVVVWMDEVDGPEGCVEYAVDGEPPETLCGMPDEQGQYEITLPELPVDVPVVYTASVGERSAGPFTFQTAPSNDAAVKLLITADIHANEAVFGAISQAALEEGVHLAVGVGDLISQPEEDQWDAFFRGLRALGHRVCFWPVQGNHERKHASYFHHFVAPEGAPTPRPPEAYYAARVGQVWFSSMELDDWTIHAFSMGGDTPEVTFVRDAIQSEEARSARWRILFIHQPPWAKGWGHCDGYEGEKTLREYLMPFAVENNVDLMFFGHMHGYERGIVDGVPLVTTGGGGGALDHECPYESWPEPWLGVYEYHYTIVEAGCDELTVTARTLDGDVIDEFSVEASETRK